MALTSSSTRIFTHLIVIITVSTIGVSRPQQNGKNWKTVQDASLRRTRANERATFFDLELLEVLGRSFQNRNMILSPISIKVLLGALMEGAGGETRNEISHAVRLYDDAEATRMAVRSWVSLFKSNSTQTELKLATHMFLSLNNEINEDYGNILRKYYMGDVSNINVANPAESAQTVNDWVSRVTNGFIPTLVSEAQISYDTMAVLASAVYFKSKWLRAFDGTLTNCFYKKTGVCTDTVFMQKTDQLNHAYISSLEADVVEIPYKDERYSMVIMVPKGRVQELERDLQHGYLTDILSKLTPKEIHLQLPRFTADSDQDVIPALQQLQINELFRPSANLSGIFSNSNGLLTISNILHSAKIIVDEDGTEAAGATAALLVPLIGKHSTTFIVNKPFVFLIRDSVTNVILFAGQIFDPETAKISDTNEGVHGLGDKSSNVDYSNTLENVDAVHQASDKEHKHHKKPGRPDLLPPKDGKPNGFLSSKPTPPPPKPLDVSINFEGPSDKQPNSEGLSDKNYAQNTLPKLPPQVFLTTATPLPLFAPPTKAPPPYRQTSPPLLKRTTSPPLLRPTTSPPLYRRTTSPPLLRQTTSPPLLRRPTTPLSRRTIAPSTLFQPPSDIPNGPPPQEGLFSKQSILRSIHLSDTTFKDYGDGPFVHKHFSITHVQVSDPPKTRRSPDQRIVFAT